MTFDDTNDTSASIDTINAIFGIRSGDGQSLLAIPACNFTDQEATRLTNFLNLRSSGNRIKLLTWILFIKEYNFIPDNSKEAKTGVTFHFCDTVNTKPNSGDTAQKGAKVESYSLSFKNPKALIDAMPQPPFLAVAEMEIQKKGVRLIQVYNVHDIIKTRTEGGNF